MGLDWFLPCSFSHTLGKQSFLSFLGAQRPAQLAPLCQQEFLMCLVCREGLVFN